MLPGMADITTPTIGPGVFTYAGIPGTDGVSDSASGPVLSASASDSEAGEVGEAGGVLPIPAPTGIPEGTGQPIGPVTEMDTDGHRSVTINEEEGMLPEPWTEATSTTAVAMPLATWKGHRPETGKDPMLTRDNEITFTQTATGMSTAARITEAGRSAIAGNGPQPSSRAQGTDHR